MEEFFQQKDTGLGRFCIMKSVVSEVKQEKGKNILNQAQEKSF